MAIFSSKILFLSARNCLLECPSDLSVHAGQYLLATPADTLDPVPVALFPAGRQRDKLIIPGALPPGWMAGLRLNLRGPLGRGFQFPTGARRVAIVDAGREEGQGSVLGLKIQSVLDAGGEVAYYSDRPPEGLPTAVEGLPLEQSAEAWKWAEYLAADVDQTQLGRLLRALRPASDSRLPDKAEILVRSRIVCGGAAECGLCAVKTVKGPRLACKDGPVFPLADLALPSMEEKR